MADNPPTPGLKGLLSAVAGGLRAGLSGLKGGVKTHGGRFSLEELKRYAQQAPGVRLALLGVERVECTSFGKVWLHARLGAFVIAAGQGRNAQALQISTALGVLVADNRWGVEEWAHTPQEARCDNLYDAALDKTGIAIWAITWRQRIELEKEQVLSDLTRVDTTLNGIQDTITLSLRGVFE